MTSEKRFDRQELLKKIYEFFGDSEFCLEHLNGEIFIFLNSFLVENVLFTQEMDVYLPFEDVFHGKTINKKSYLREKITFEQYIEFYYDKEENFPTMKINSIHTADVEKAFQLMKDFSHKILLFLTEIPKYYSGDLTYTYQDRRYKEEFLKKSIFQATPSEPVKDENPESLGYFVDGTTIKSDALKEKERMQFVILDDNLLNFQKSFRDFAQKHR